MDLLVRGEFILFDFLFYTDFSVSAYTYVQIYVLYACVYTDIHTHTQHK